MKNFLNNYKNKVHHWLLMHAESKQGMWWISFFSFIESSFFLLPVDFVLAAFISVKNSRWLRAAFWATVSSVAGGVFGYAIGFFFYDWLGKPIIDFYGLHEEMQIVGESFSKNAFWAIFVSAFTPLPYKVFTIGAGFFKINLLIFIIASLIGRGIRFFLVSYLVKLYGQAVSRFIYKYFNIFSIIGILVLVVGILFLLL